jgi:glutathione synthase/RimK-type ligase-like ATP-grasp enzyme
MSPDSPGVVLVVTHDDDDHAPAVLDELNRRGAAVVRFNTESYPERSSVRLELSGDRLDPRFGLEDGELAGADVGAVWYRHLKLPVARQVEDGEARVLAEAELRATIEGALLCLDAYWLNHPDANRLARHKPLQLALALEEGFTVPETRVTADPEEIRGLYRDWGGRMVAKLVGGQLPVTAVEDQYVVYTTLLGEDDLRSDAALSACPAIYQRYVEKEFELRLTVVGDAVFAARIYSQQSDGGSIDWRRAKRTSVRYEVEAVDAALEKRCLALARRLGLGFAGLDLIVTPDGETVFLEVNAAGQWAWLQEATGLPIAAAIADTLIAGGRAARARGPGRSIDRDWTPALP